MTNKKQTRKTPKETARYLVDLCTQDGENARQNQQKITEDIKDPEYFIQTYRELVNLQRTIWQNRSVEESVTERTLGIQRAHLEMIMAAPEILETYEQKQEEIYLRETLSKMREEMIYIRLTERYDAASRRKEK
jgi:hypothetical protein